MNITPENQSAPANQQRLILAHRGATQKKETLENTLASIEQAINQRADIVEIDVRMTWDSQFIVFHDFVLDRMTNWTGLVNTKTLKTLREVKLKNGDRIPTIDEVFKFIIKLKKSRKDAKQTKIILDIKDLNTGLFNYEKLIKKIKSYGLAKDIIFTSLSYQLLKRMAKKHPDFCYCYFSWLPTLKTLNRARGMKAEYVGSMFLTKSFVKRAHKKNLKVISLGTDKKKKLEWYFKNGVDIISTSKPLMLRQLINECTYQEKERLKDKTNLLIKMWKRFSA